MIEEALENENFGYQMPKQLVDMNWKKCFSNQNMDNERVLEVIIRIRQYLSQNTEVNHLIKEVLATEVHKQLFKYGKKVLERIVSGEGSGCDVQCLYEIIWIFTNLCSGQKSSTTVILELGIVNFCKQLFALQNLGNIIAILFDLIGNLAGELSMGVKLSFLGDPKFYNFMRNKYMNYIDDQNFHSNSSWAFSNLFRDFDSCQDKFTCDNFEDLLLGYYPIINDLLQIDDQEAIYNLLYIFYYISKVQNFHFNSTLQIIERFITDHRTKISHLTMQIVGNYIAVSDQGVEFALNHPHFLNVVFNFLKSPEKMKQRKQAAWIISNIFAGTVTQVDKFVSIPTLFNELCLILNEQQNETVIRQFVWSISNSFSSCSEKSFNTIYYSSIIEPLSGKMMSCEEKASFLVYLNGVSEYLKKFSLTPNLNFNVFLRNITQIQPVINLAQCAYSEFPNITTKIEQIRQKICKLIQRGPISEEEMTKLHLENFSI